MYKFVLHLKTPLHVGAGRVGNLQLARPFLIGKTLWGALTARITRDTRPGATGSDYREIGDQIKEQLAFSYFYPSTGQEVDVWPWDDDADEFDWRYMDTYTATARNPKHNTALHGSLHETEFIAPTTRDDDPVYMIGYVFERDDGSLSWHTALSRLQLGGERTYGWGRVRAEDPLPHAPFFAGWDVALDGDRPVLQAADDKTRLLAHTVATDSKAPADVRGAVEPLVGRETRKANRHGKEPVLADICWKPGTPVPKGTQVRIGNYGIWKFV
jgi:hypothetical protein